MPGDIRPFKINVPDEAIALLKRKLADATFPEATDFTEDWKSGAVASDVKRLAQRWQSGFNWRVQEEKLNEVPQFTTEITVDGFEPIEMHFVHQRSRPGSIPLLFCHGWPGSFIEVVKLLPLLTSPNGGGPTFHVVAPSLPNFGFSGIVKEKGFGLKQYAEAMHKVMLTLGYEKYVTQGGDWGFFITRYMAQLYPSHCLASHVNILGASGSLGQMSWAALKWSLGMLSDRDKTNLKNTWKHLTTGMGYLLIQGTKPNTLGLGFADSPVAVLAWVYEKLVGWTDEYPWTDDEVLTWISIYQFSKAGPAASIRIYHEWMQMGSGERNAMMNYVPTVPLGISHFPKEMTPVPDGWAQNLGPVVYEAIHGRGGHFAAYEEPELLAQDLKNMFSTTGSLPKVVQYFSDRRK